MGVPTAFKSWQQYFDRHVAECEDCAPYFQGDGQMSAEGQETEVESLPYEIGIPVRFARRVIENGRCDGCGAAVGEMINVWARPTSEAKFRALVERAIARHGKRISHFHEFLKQHPYLGASHPTGRMIMRTVAKIAATSVQGTWFRCIKERDGAPDLDDFRAPVEDQEHPINEGRFNHSGQAHWYLANERRTAIDEVLDGTAGVVWTLEFKIESCTKVLDVSRSIEGDSGPPSIDKIEAALALVMMGALDGYVDRKRAWKPGYFVPRFVMDAAKRAGFEAIRYRSVRAVDGENLVLFRRDWPAGCVSSPQRHVETEPPGFEVVR